MTLALAAVLVLAPPAVAQGSEDPSLDQTIERDQAIVPGPAELVDGHVDIGPRYLDRDLTLLVHDDAVEPSVWRPLEETVLRVGDDAIQTVPDDPTYDFLGVDAGTDVYVVPQVQRDGVVWLGWNTQDPEVLESIDRGASLTLLGVDGPGALTVYLQSGTLGEPEVLWQSAVTERQSIWVEVNTHTHANWVFTEPGVYLVQVEIAADLISGDAVADVRTLRFAVGDATSAEHARSAEPSRALPAEPEGSAGGEAVGEEQGGEDGGGSGVVIVLAVVAVALLGGLGLAIASGSRAKRRAEAERAGAASADAS